MNPLFNHILNILAGAGNALDLPGSSVRDILAGRNPFDQWATPFHEQNRTTGRQLARDYGLAGDQDNWGNWLGGMAVETALDPMSYIGLGLLNKGVKMKPGQMVRAMWRNASDPIGHIDDGMRAAGQHSRNLAEAVANRNAWARRKPIATHNLDNYDDILDGMDDIGMDSHWINSLDDTIDADQAFNEALGLKPVGKFEEARMQRQFEDGTRKFNELYRNPEGHVYQDPNAKITPGQAMMNNAYKKRVRKPKPGVNGIDDAGMGM